MGNSTPKVPKPLPKFSVGFYRSSWAPDSWKFDKLKEIAREKNQAILVLIGNSANKTETQLKIKTSNKEYYEMLINQGAGVYVWHPFEENENKK